MAKLRSAMLRQGATPVLDISLDEAVQDATVYVTINQGDRQLTKSNYNEDPSVTLTPVYDDEDVQIGTDISVIFNQAETLYLKPGFGRIQVRWIFEDGTADGSDIGRIEIGESLLKVVIANGRH